MEKDFLMCIYSWLNKGIRLRWERGTETPWNDKYSSACDWLCICGTVAMRILFLRVISVWDCWATPAWLWLGGDSSNVTSYLLTKIGLADRELWWLNFPFSLLNKHIFANCWHVSTLDTEWDQFILPEMVQMLEDLWLQLSWSYVLITLCTSAATVCLLVSFFLWKLMTMMRKMILIDTICFRIIPQSVLFLSGW